MTEPQEMAHRLVATALMMKREFQAAGLLVAREFCDEYGIDVYELERKLRETGREFGRKQPLRMGQIDATEDGRAWFWAGRHAHADGVYVVPELGLDYSLPWPDLREES